MDKETVAIIEFLKSKYEGGTFDIKAKIIIAIRDITVASSQGNVRIVTAESNFVSVTPEARERLIKEFGLDEQDFVASDSE